MFSGGYRNGSLYVCFNMNDEQINDFLKKKFFQQLTSRIFRKKGKCNKTKNPFFPFLDINECLTNNGECSVNAQCANVVGGTGICTCNTGYTGDGITCTGNPLKYCQKCF